MRKRMLRETEVALLYGLRFPKRQPRIPTMEVGKGEWHPVFVAQFEETEPMAVKRPHVH